MSADVETTNMAKFLVGQSPSPDYLPDDGSASICPLIVPSPSSSAADFQVDTLGLTAPSSSADFIRDDESCSICPLLTPSPTGADFTQTIDPLTELEYKGQSESRSDLSDLINTNNNYNEFDCKEKCGSVSDEGDEQQIIFTAKARTSLPRDLLESSASSSSSALQETTCAQLLGNNHYQHLNIERKDVGAFIQQENGKSASLDLTSRKLSSDYCFISWNWPLIRKLTFISLVSIKLAGLCLIVSMIAMLPSRCYPFHFWYQGTIFYEIFPPSFQDSNFDGIGDLKGISGRVDYVEKLGVDAIRLNSIFATDHFPEDFKNVKNLTEIEKSLGTLKDFATLLDVYHNRNIKVILDLPIYPLVKELSELNVVLRKEMGRKDVEGKITNTVHNHRSHREIDNQTDTNEQRSRVRRQICCTETTIDKQNVDPRLQFLKPEPYIDGGISGLMKHTSQHLNSITETIVTDAIKYWFDVGVDGFYIKGLENYLEDPKFVEELRKWKKTSFDYWREDKEKLLMCDYVVYKMAVQKQNVEAEDAILDTMDLLDVGLDLSNGTYNIKRQIEEYQAGELYDKQNNPWIQWNIGNVDTKRLSSESNNNASLGALLFEMMLPGTVSIFYGDEIGIQDLHDPLQERHDIRHVHQLSPMSWLGGGFTRNDIIPWLPYSKRLAPAGDNVNGWIQEMSQIRNDSPSIYMNSIWKQNENLINCIVRYVDDEIIVMERSFPRRDSYVAVANFGSKTVERDLSYIYYGGTIVADGDNDIGRSISFKYLSITPGNTFIIKLFK